MSPGSAFSFIIFRALLASFYDFLQLSFCFVSTYSDNIVRSLALTINGLKGSLTCRLIETEQTSDEATHEQTGHDDYHIEQIALTEKGSLQLWFIRTLF